MGQAIKKFYLNVFMMLGILIIGFLFFVSSVLAQEPRCMLLYYPHKTLPNNVLYMYDWIVLDADTPYMEVLKKKGYLQKKRAKLIGYMSVGEIEPYRDYYEEIEQYSIGTNSMWGSLVADVRNQEYRQFLLNVVTKRIADKGFDGFFLDTLDSYQLVVKEEEWKDFQDALVDFVKELRKRYPDKLIVLNRGFEFIDRVKDDVNGLLVESLFSGLDAEKNYREVSEEEREWLLAQLNRVKSYGLPVIMVDYVDPQDNKKAKELVRKIAELGFIPYVADRDLSVIGYSLCSLNPKEVWMFKKYYKIF